jgi:hypothetical protein
MVLVVALHIRDVVFAPDREEQANGIALKEVTNHYFIFDKYLKIN